MTPEFCLAFTHSALSAFRNMVTITNEVTKSAALAAERAALFQLEGLRSCRRISSWKNCWRFGLHWLKRLHLICNVLMEIAVAQWHRAWIHHVCARYHLMVGKVTALWLQTATVPNAWATCAAIVGKDILNKVELVLIVFCQLVALNIPRGLLSSTVKLVKYRYVTPAPPLITNGISAVLWVPWVDM